MDRNMEAKDREFTAPRAFGMINWINIVALLAIGSIGVMRGIDLTKTDGLGGILLIVGSLVLTVWLIAMWKFISEFLLASFEQLKVLRQLRAKQDEMCEFSEQSIDMLGTIVRDLSGIKMTQMSVLSEVHNLNVDDKPMQGNPQRPWHAPVKPVPVQPVPVTPVPDGRHPPEPVLTTCPFCGKETEIPVGVVAGQHIRCPYCHQKFTL